MAQKLILCEAATNVDILASSPAVAACLADGFTVSSVSGYTSRDNRNMCLCFVLLTKTEVAPATEETTPAAETTTTTETTETTTETEPSGEGGEGGE